MQQKNRAGPNPTCNPNHLKKANNLRSWLWLFFYFRVYTNTAIEYNDLEFMMMIMKQKKTNQNKREWEWIGTWAENCFLFNFFSRVFFSFILMGRFFLQSFVYHLWMCGQGYREEQRQTWVQHITVTVTDTYYCVPLRKSRLVFSYSISNQWWWFSFWFVSVGFFSLASKQAAKKGKKEGYTLRRLFDTFWFFFFLKERFDADTC